MIGTCFAYEKLDHKVKDYPLNNKLPPKSLAHTKVYIITEHNSKTSKSLIEGIIYVSNINVKVLFTPIPIYPLFHNILLLTWAFNLDH